MLSIYISNLSISFSILFDHVLDLDLSCCDADKWQINRTGSNLLKTIQIEVVSMLLVWVGGYSAKFGIDVYN